MLARGGGELSQRFDGKTVWLRANLEGHHFYKRELSGVIFQKCDFTGAMFADSTIFDCRFEECNFVEANFSSAHIHDCRFYDSDLSEATLTRATISHCTLTRVIFSSASIQRAELMSVEAISCNFLSGNLEKTRLTDSNFLSCNFFNTNLEEAVFDNCNLSNSVLTNARLGDTKFINTILLATILEDKTKAMKKALRECLQPNGGLILYRTNTSRHYATGTKYIPGKTYVAPVLSNCTVTDCHPGIYGLPKSEAEVQFPRSRANLVKIYVPAGEWVFVSATKGFRCKRVRVIENYERGEE